MLVHSSSRLTNNNFDLLRFLFAGAVCLVHAYQLSGYQELAWIVSVLSSAVAVKSFFVVSGFLIFMSFERSSSIASYAKKRIRRIYPAYATVVLISAVVMVFISSVDTNNYFSVTWLKYLVSNLTFLNFLQPSLPGVFEGNVPTAVNGALWTLKIEVMFYLSVPVFVYLFRRFSRFSMLVLFYCLSVIYSVLLTDMANQDGFEFYAQLARQLPGQLSYFMAGAFLYYFLPLFERRVGRFMAAAILILVINHFYPLPLFEPFALATVVVFFGLFLYMGNFGKYGDFSYGIYIVHFPIIQILLWGDWFSESPWYFLVAVVLMTLTAGFLMWNLVEKRFLLRNSHYVAAAQVHGK